MQIGGQCQTMRIHVGVPRATFHYVLAHMCYPIVDSFIAQLRQFYHAFENSVLKKPMNTTYTTSKCCVYHLICIIGGT